LTLNWQTPTYILYHQRNASELQGVTAVEGTECMCLTQSTENETVALGGTNATDSSTNITGALTVK